MIEKINKIRNFGSYKDYKWRCTENFGSVNLFFGWNYSGKTVLSRIFSSFERCENYHKDSSFSIKVDGKDLDEDSLASYSNIRVFNKDFVKRNLRWDESEADPFAILGEESSLLKDKLDNLEKQKETLRKESEPCVLELNNLRNSIETNGTTVAKTIKEDFNQTTYNRTKLEEEIKELPEQIDDAILTQKEYEKQFKIFNTTEEKRKLLPVLTEIQDLNDEYTLILELCSKTVSSERIQSLIDNENLGEWVKQGLSLHKGYSQCRFCESILDNDLLEKYRRHFSKEYDALLSDLRDERKKLTSFKQDLPSHTREQFYPDIVHDFEDAQNKVNYLIDEYNKKIDTLVEFIDEKTQNIFESLVCKPFQYTVDTTPLEDYNRIIRRNFETTDNLLTLKKDALVKLKRHRVASHVKNSNYKENMKKTSEHNSKISEINTEIEKIEFGIHEVRLKASNIDKAADRVNDILRECYGKNNIVIRYEEEKFFFYRHDIRAKDLSEGEQTAVAFSYFIARLEKSDISKLIIFIDDPISSLDSNHLFLTYSMIRDKFYFEDKLACDQLFVSTHNYEFFIHLKKGLKGKVNKEGNRTYLIRRINKDTSVESTIIDLPMILKDYDSEYAYLYSRVFDFKDKPDSNFDQIYDLPNIVRKILDIYSSFKHQGGFREMGRKIFPDHVYNQVYKFVNHNSHSRVDGLLLIPNLTECQTIVDLVLEYIKKDDPVHYDSILKKLNFELDT